MQDNMAVTVIKAGKLLKAVSGVIEIDFRHTFKHLPVVQLTSFWPNGQVNNIETVISVANGSCAITSGNFGDNYYVFWTAFGE
jgi:hypothetical protein